MDKETVKRAMEATITLLGEIQVPVVLAEQITKPIALAINNMKIGINALEEGETEDGNADAE